MEENEIGNGKALAKKKEMERPWRGDIDPECSEEGGVIYSVILKGWGRKRNRLQEEKGGTMYAVSSTRTNHIFS